MYRVEIVGSPVVALRGVKSLRTLPTMARLQQQSSTAKSCYKVIKLIAS